MMHFLSLAKYVRLIAEKKKKWQKRAERLDNNRTKSTTGPVDVSIKGYTGVSTKKKITGSSFG